MKDKTFRILLGVLGVLCVLVYLIPFLYHHGKTAQQDPYAMLEEMDRAARETFGEDCEMVSQSVIVPYQYDDGQGGIITYSLCRTFYLTEDVPELTGLSPILDDVIDPAAATESRACQVGEFPAMLYETDGVSYLCWTVSAEYSMALAVNPAHVSEADMIEMAESVPTDTIS